ncbi:MAG: TIM barrel protein [Rhizobiales bacterium]|nr:TIM barrel protein [Hyphomicrobiales bacterium]MBO6697924.1 TIM barrel protein [Hyphomicrobiales bacterium]MBO6735822.1 TIM barrel protein [Hyphomicrobiales bacterium]MBO6913833.1 TIM barrel protein [Hyphomicrobiales bacterium]MBO6955536.1 TIM barrel protein [Hyphomicrobiales bacterium]
MRFSANLGFLWTELSLPDAVRAAKRAGFDAVECHWPYDTPADEVALALEETGMAMLGLNTARGDVAAGENGLAALPGRESDARAAIDQAIDYAHAVGAQNVHVMAGFASGEAAHKSFIEALRYAGARAAPHGIGILIEPLNRYDAPGYFLQTTGQAVAILDEVASDSVRLMFDCYHVQLMEGDLSNRLMALLPRIGHVQFASVPDRCAPDQGEVDYAHIFALLDDFGYAKPLGAEYKPHGSTDDTLGWLAKLRT